MALTTGEVYHVLQYLRESYAPQVRLWEFTTMLEPDRTRTDDFLLAKWRRRVPGNEPGKAETVAA